MDTVQRFTSRVEDYARYRPSYPAAVTGFLARECRLTANSRVADIGSGTGLLTELFLRFGCEVTGVEPNAQMRAAGDRMLAAWPRFRSVDGRAEVTTLADASVDFVTAGQAFHWFDPLAARREFQRILMPAGWAVMVWNERQPTPGFMRGYEDLVARYGPEHPHAKTEELNTFFGAGAWRLVKLPNYQEFDFEGLRGRLLSSSYAPLPGTPSYEPLMEELGRLFREYQKDGRVTLVYETEVYTGQLLPAASIA